MDAITFSCLLPILALLPLSLFLFFTGKQRTDPLLNNPPPGSTGFPVVGENIEYAISGPENFVKQRMKKFSPDVFKTSLMGETMAIFCGPQGNKFLFMNENKVLGSWWPQSMKKTLLFPNYVNDPLKDVAALTHRFLLDALRPEALKQYIPVMDSLAREHLEKHWVPHSEVKVFPLSKVYTFTLVCKIFMGIDDPETVQRLMKNFNVVTNGMFSVPIDFPGTAYNRAIKGGTLVHKELMKIIAARKKELMEETVRNDLMSRMLLATDEKGQFLREMEVSNKIMGLLVASYESTSNALAFVLKHLSELPHIYAQVLGEQMEIAKSKAPGELLNWDDIQKMAYSWNVARESIRVTPPANGGFREAVTDFTFAGFTIPKGWKTFWTVYTTHKNPKYFPDPEKFDPGRFEGNGPEPYTFVPFGGGARMCPGKEYARLEVLVLMHNVVNLFRLKKLNPDEKIVFHHSPVPENGLPVHLLRHEKCLVNI